MKPTRKPIGPIGLLSIALTTGLIAESARGELLDISADVDVSATIFDSATVLVSDQEMITVATDQTGVATAQAVRFSLSMSGVAAAARSAMFFSDPFPDPPDPIQEFGGELFGFSRDNTINIQMTGDVFETRTIIVTPEEAGAPDGDATLITGDMFFHGAIVVLSNEQDGDLRGLEALAGFEIELQRSGADPVIVQSGVLEVRGILGNQIIVDGDGSLDDFNFPVINLSPDFPDLGTVYVVLFPRILIPYVYTVNVGEEYVLVGRLRLKATSVPDHVGVGVTTGGPFKNLADLLDEILGGEPGSGPGGPLQNRIADLLAEFGPLDPPLFSFELITESCAPLGLESLGLVGLLGAIGATRRRRRRQSSTAGPISAGHRQSCD